MSTVPNGEFQEWNNTRKANKFIEGRAVLGTSTAAIGGSTSGTVSTDYKNQQAGPYKDELKIDAGYGQTDFDFYALEAGGTQGYPPTEAMELQIYKAAINAAFTTAETIPPQNQVALMQAARKAHNNWRQRRQQLLTQAQMRAANQVVIDADMAKMTAGEPLDGVAHQAPPV
jgi:hypothetical protein